MREDHNKTLELGNSALERAYVKLPDVEAVTCSSK